MSQANSDMHGTATPAGSRCICRCQLLGDNTNLYDNYMGIPADSLPNYNDDGGTACCTVCYGTGYK